jgi:hypothetical protein
MDYPRVGKIPMHVPALVWVGYGSHTRVKPHARPHRVGYPVVPELPTLSGSTSLSPRKNQCSQG